MPCDRITVCTIDFAKCDTDILEAALRNLGYAVYNINGTLVFNTTSGRATIGNGKLSMSGYATEAEAQTLASTIKQAFGAETVKRAAKKNGWAVEIVSPTKIKVKKRRM